MKRIAVVILLLWPCLAQAQYQPPTYVTPFGNGAYVVTQPGATPYQPPTYINPMGNGGYVETQPGATPYEPPTYINPLPNGGSVITQPGAGAFRGGDSDSEVGGDSN